MSHHLIVEKERILTNQQNLLENLPECVFILHRSGRVEYMNPSAKKFIQNSHFSVNSIWDLTSFGEKNVKHKKIEIKDQVFQYSIAPFLGYKGDSLLWFSISKDCKSLSPNNIGSTSSKPLQRTLVGSSATMRKLQEIATLIAQTDTTVLINGESGTGKDLLAHILHQHSPRAPETFLPINCTTINDQLLESELFGYEKGAFTGAETQRPGKFEIADGGTIFLDEIGDISPRMQSVLLRVLQDKEIIRVGGTTPVKVDVRVVAATNRDLAKAVEEGTFRLDLFYRLNTFNLSVPPLRDRGEDVKELAEYFLNQYSEKLGLERKSLTKNAVKILILHDWPGNVRELENVIQRAMLTCSKAVIDTADIQFNQTNQHAPAFNLKSLQKQMQGSSIKSILGKIEEQIIHNTLKDYNGNVKATAKCLKISKATLYEKLRRYGLSAKVMKNRT